MSALKRSANSFTPMTAGAHRAPLQLIHHYPRRRERCGRHEFPTIHILFQNTNLNPNCICRGVVPCASALTLPALAAICVAFALIINDELAGTS